MALNPAPTLLSLPSEGVFDTFKLSYDHCQEHAKLAGYAFVIGRTDKKYGRLIRTLIYKRGGKHKDKVGEDRVRDRGSFKAGCQFAVRVRETLEGTWKLSHIEGRDAYNHDAGEPTSFPEHRKLTEEQKRLVTSHHATRIPASRTATVLRKQGPDVYVHHRDIWNITAAVVREKRAGKSPAESLISRLEAEKADRNVYFEYRLDVDGHIAMLFVADTRSVEYLDKHPDVLLLDCTYQTNKFDMPLLNIIAVNYYRNTFTVGFCLLDVEAKANYDKAIQYLVKLFRPRVWPSVIRTDCELALIKAIEKHFPILKTKRILYFWHIAKNLLVNYKDLFLTEER